MPKSLRSFPKSEWRHIDPTDDPLAYGSEVKGDCCAPAIQDGDIAMFSPSTAVKAGMYVGLFFKSGARAVKRLSFLAPPMKKGDEVSHLHRVEMDNPKRAVFVRPETVEKMHAVAGVVRGGKFISLLEGHQ